MSEPFTLRVRGEPIGVAHGVENWARAAAFVCDAYGRTATTPRWAFDATFDAAMYRALLEMEPLRTDHWAEPPLTNFTKGWTQPDAED